MKKRSNRDARYYTPPGSYHGAIKVGSRWVRANELNRIDKSSWQRWMGPPSSAILKAMRSPNATIATAFAPGGPSNVGKSTATVRAHLRRGKPVREHVRHLSPHAKQALGFYRGLKKGLGAAAARSKALSFFYGQRQQGHNLRLIGRSGVRRVRIAVEPKVGWRP